jgi:CrcB protein
MDRFLIVFIGGGMGSGVRYGASLLAGKTLGTGFAWGTLLVNLAGCFLIGVNLGLAENTNIMQPSLRLFFVTGFLGGLTTFSSYALESVVAMRGGVLAAMLNIAANNIAGLALVLAGVKLVEIFTGG